MSLIASIISILCETPAKSSFIRYIPRYLPFDLILQLYF